MLSNSSRNVQLIVLKTTFGGIGRAIYWFVGSFIVYALGGENSNYGDISAIAGLVGLFAVLFAGAISDKIGKRAWLLYIGIALETLGFLFFSFANTMVLVLIGSSIISLSAGFMVISQTTILADSTSSKEKNQIFAIWFLAENFAFGIGFLLAYLTFQNDATLNLQLLLFAMKIAFVFLLVEFFLSMLVKDKYSVRSVKKPKEIVQMENEAENKTFGYKIPVLVTLSGFIISLGAGTSIIFLNRFFQLHYHLELGTIAFLSSIMIFITAFWGKAMGDIADKFGRVPSIVSTQLVATILLFILSTYPPLFLGVATLLIRNAFMNASSPVSNALLTDNVPIYQRARWSSISSLGWTTLFSIGNIIGGRIIDLYDFNVAFFITATLYLIGTLILLLIKEEDAIITTPIIYKADSITPFESLE